MEITTLHTLVGARAALALRSDDSSALRSLSSHLRSCAWSPHAHRAAHDLAAEADARAAALEEEAGCLPGSPLPRWGGSVGGGGYVVSRPIP
mgnify:CR=1 FL=1